MQVRLFKPSIGRKELKNIEEAFGRAWIGLGPKVVEFESAWSEYIGSKNSVAVNSGTAALHMACAAYRFPRGKKVLVPAMTFIATASAPMYEGLQPVFVDCDEHTLGMDLEDLERKIDSECVAVIPVHFGGHPAPMDDLLNLARSRGLKVIEDCAHCPGGEYKGKKLGTWGDMGCFSFEEKKGMTTGDGGMLCSDDNGAVEYVKPMRWVGMDKDTWKRSASYTGGEDLESRHWYYEINLLGYKYNMNDLCASIGLAQLEKLDGMNEARRKAIARYLEGLKDAQEARPMFPYDLEENSSYWIFGLRHPRRDELMARLKSSGIATGLHYTPLPLHPIFKGNTDAIPNSLKVYDEIITLPLFADITHEEIDYVIEAVLEFEKA